MYEDQMQTRDLNEIVPQDAADRLSAFRRAVSAALPGAVLDVVLFGSRARGDAPPDSDCDVAVILADGLGEDRGVRGRLADAAREHVIDGTIIQAIAMPVGAFSVSSATYDELAARVAAEGVSVR
jgi:predicted nucleotidyltransferase